jgi:alginate O-acetyltransferase complex protein AlgI
MWTTMLASGIWHGASWTFVAWGAAHALLLSVERITRWPERLSRIWGGKALATLLTLALVLVGWVLFRAESLSQAGFILRAMFSGSLHLSDALLFPSRALALAALMLGLEFAAGVKARPRLLVPQSMIDWIQPAGVACLVVACVFLRGPGAAFVYFQF